MTRPQARYEIVADDKSQAAWTAVLKRAETHSKKIEQLFKGASWLVPTAALASRSARRR